MPSSRRLKVLLVFVLAIVITTLFFTSQKRAARDGFYTKTESALNRAHHPHADPGLTGDTVGGGAQAPLSETEESDEDVAKAMASRVQEAAKVARENANKKSLKPDHPDKVVGVGNAAEGNSVGSTEKDRSAAGKKKYPLEGKEEEPVKQLTDEEKEVELELNSILKRSPIIIFSKSYCPYSRKAKGILLEKYSIVPAPYVVELDQHPLGPQLQAHLAKTTGRKTVPNVLINGKSIGGGDDVAELDSRRTLIEKVKSMGGKRMVEVAERQVEV